MVEGTSEGCLFPHLLISVNLVVLSTMRSAVVISAPKELKFPELRASVSAAKTNYNAETSPLYLRINAYTLFTTSSGLGFEK